MNYKTNCFVTLIFCSTLLGCSGGSDEGNKAPPETNTSQETNAGSNTNDNSVTQDTTAPSITIMGDNPITIDFGTPYSDAGAEATDANDGAVSVSVTSDVNVSKVGEYSVEYTAQDKAGNIATASRQVIVQDVLPPSITILGANPVIVEGGSEYVDEGATAFDLADGAVSVTTQSNVNVQLVGEYIVNYTASDTLGNTATATRTVIVQDSKPPQITLLGDNPLTIKFGLDYIEPGANAVDILDGEVPVITTSNLNTEVMGEYSIEYTATDRQGNIATASRTIVVEDIHLENIIEDKNLLSCLLEQNLTYASQVREVVCRDRSIQSAAGIEHLRNMTKLDLGSADYYESLVDIRKFAPGDYDSSKFNSITVIDLTRNTKLEYLDLQYNNLGLSKQSLDLRKNTNLKHLNLSINQLKHIDVSNNINLEKLDLAANNLTAVDVSKQTQLIELSLSFNQLTNFDITNNTNLTGLDISYNQINEADLTYNLELETIICERNNFTNIEVKHLSNLNALYCSFNQLADIDVSENLLLEKLVLDDNKLVELNVRNNIELRVLSLSFNPLKTIDLTKNIHLESLFLSSDVICYGAKCGL
ncbi:DUF5011 domain-containing protein [Pseudoalteromonas sp. JBTF-M23]|uniref:DUF5011 domain-containing protein n=1 Tax=Pseudoalteromonas caenipelagi TaxID=2726988 RepID=A0A849VA61_9GAMM|nr:immunoglobulin-like domain-containing protein [Pseudoalteromonas caenipelagi]NOU49815.1 DUF5011 domain-containing protein [Pseudoalteromonas caenipelagi]